MNTFGVTDGSVSPSATASSSGPRQQQRPLAIWKPWPVREKGCPVNSAAHIFSP